MLVSNVVDAAFRRDAFHVLEECQVMCYRGNEENIEQRIYDVIDEIMTDYSTSNDIPERRSLGRVSVPMWLFCLSAQLCIVALVGRYLTNQLISRESILKRIAPLITVPCGTVVLCGISSHF